MDGNVEVIRKELDLFGYYNTSIMSYSAKYASSFYGPFRDAVNSELSNGDRKSHQMNPANQKEALKQMKIDVENGSDIIIIKPAISYLDIIHLAKTNFLLPVAAYQVSGEYAMIKAASKLGWINEQEVMLESLLSIKRAGADIIVSYFCEEIANLLLKQ